jgi:DNA-binding transcriptional MerR regulator
MLGISRTVVERLIEAGFVSPARGRRGERRFDFQDIVMLRTAHSLRTAGVSPRKIVRALEHLRKRWARGGSLTGLRLAAVGNSITVRDERNGRWDAESGQLLIEFEPKPGCGTVASLEPRTGPRQQKEEPNAIDLFREGEDLEAEQSAAAEEAYRRALEVAPDYTDASLNLGCLLCDSERYEDAIAVFRHALAFRSDEPVLHFNLGVALEDMGRVHDALRSYEACMSLAPDFADAHFNAARIHEELGEAAMAIRHFNRYRTLQKR